jgi:hypothetical protein
MTRFAVRTDAGFACKGDGEAEQLNSYCKAADGR